MTPAPRSVTVLGSTGSVGTQTVQLLAAHPEIADTLITERFPLDDAAAAFRAAADRASGSIKIVLEP